MDNNASAGRKPFSFDVPEPGFIQSHGWLVAPPVQPDHRLLEHLVHRVSRNPMDLIVHVQRIMLSARLCLHEELYGALLDLFIALGKKGYLLRARLFEQCRALLSRQQQQALLIGLFSGIAALDIVPMTVHSRLTAGITGRLDIVSVDDAAEQAPLEDVLTEAHDLIDSGQIDAARTLLESALIATPSNHLLSHDLLAIYRHTRNLDGLNAMLNRLEREELALRSEWEAMAARLAAENDHE